MKTLWKSLRGQSLILGVIGWLGSGLLRVLYHTLTVTHLRRDGVDQLLHGDRRPLIFAFWHGCLLMMSFAYPETATAILISRHPDGEMIARVASRLGLTCIRGSARRGAAPSLLAMVHAYKKGFSLAITPDGPLGPRSRVKPGILHLARLTGAPIVPVAFAASRAKVLKSWDQFFIPAPFAKGAFVWGEPLRVPCQATGDQVEALRLLLEERLHGVTIEAERVVRDGR